MNSIIVANMSGRGDKDVDQAAKYLLIDQAMGKHIVYFDLETQKSFSAVGGSKNKAMMGVSVGVAYSTQTGQYHIYDHDNVHERRCPNTPPPNSSQ